MENRDFFRKLWTIESRIQEKFGLTGRQPGARLRKAHRYFPRGLRRCRQDWLEAQDVISHPKLRRQIDSSQLSRDQTKLLKYLDTVDPRKRRIDRWLGIAGSIAFGLLVLTAAVICVLVWRGFI